MTGIRIKIDSVGINFGGAIKAINSVVDISFVEMENVVVDEFDGSPVSLLQDSKLKSNFFRAENCLSKRSSGGAIFLSNSVLEVQGSFTNCTS